MSATKSLADEVRDGYALGWSFTLLGKTPEKAKIPLLGGWQERPRHSLLEVERWIARGHNIGIRTGDPSGGVFVLDRDAKTTKIPDSAIPVTVTARTPRGGTHSYLRMPKSWAIKNWVGELGEHIDIRTTGGQAVFVGSVNFATGGMYEWVEGRSPRDVPIADCTPELEALLKQLYDEHQAKKAKEKSSSPAPRSSSPPPPAAGATSYAKAALAKECDVVRAAGKGTRNATLNTAAFNLGQLVGGGELFEQDVRQALKDSAAGWIGDDCNATEIDKTIESGLQDGKWKPRNTPDKPARKTGLTAKPTNGQHNGHHQDVSEKKEEWPEPKSLPEPLPPVMPFDMTLLPSTLRAWVRDIAERMQCPPDFPAVAAMIALAAVVGRRIGIRPRRYGDWLVIPNLWGAVVGRPGVMKSPSVKEPLKPLRRLEARAREKYEADVLEYETEQAIVAARKDKRKKDIKALVASGASPADIASQIGEEPKPKAPPTQQRYTINDCTVEKLGMILQENPLGVLAYRDELVGLLVSLDKEGQESARQFYLEAWNGDNDFTFDRVGRGTLHIESLCLSVLGGVQPGPIYDYLRDAIAGGKGDDGLIQRFQLIVYPDISNEWQNVDRPPDKQARDLAYDVYERLSKLSPTDVQAESDPYDNDAVPFLRFTPEAQDVFNTWLGELETRLRRRDETQVMEGHLSKYRSLVPSLALLLHLASSMASGPVPAEAVQKAVAWSKYLESHANRLYEPATNPGPQAARALGRRIMKGDLSDRFTVRQVYHRHHWSGLTDAEGVTAAAGLLVECGWLRELQVKDTGGRPSTFYLINPKLKTAANPTGAAPIDENDPYEAAERAAMEDSATN